MEKTSLPKYSVLMSLYIKEQPEYFRLAVDSMLNQTVAPDEILIVEDGPLTDELYVVLSEFKEKYPQVVDTIKLEKNCGLSFALNEGLKKCRNELVARMDTDDYSLSSRCEKQLEFFANNPNLSLLGTQTRYFKNTPDDAEDKIHYHPIGMTAIKKEIRRYSPFGHPTVMYKKSAVLACGGYDIELRRSQDYDLFSKMIAAGYDADNIDEALVLFRADDKMMERNKSKASCIARVAIQKKLYKLGECSLGDLLFIQLAMFISRMVPISVYSFIYKIVKGK